MHHDEPLVDVEVLVNFDGLRRGWRGQVELTRRIEALAGRGYLKILGHVDVPPAVSPPPLPATPPTTPTRVPSVSRTKRAATTSPPDGGGTDGDSPGAP